MLLEMQAFMTLLIIPLLLKEQVGAREMAQWVKY